MMQRILANNPSLMTGLGTNTYLLGTGAHKIVIDPGPNDRAHCNAIIEHAGGVRSIKAILVTHMHPDHSSNANALSKQTGAPIYGGAPVNDPYQDTSCQPTVQLTHKQTINLPELSLTAVHTPGHVANHLCYWWPEQSVMFTGDHIMHGSSVVIIPPHGNMQHYLESLTLLTHFPIMTLAPGHGELMHNPADIINGLIEHRMTREQQILASIQQPSTIDDLTSRIYQSLNPALLPMAQHNVHAHLLKLESENRAQQHQDFWQRVTPH